MNTVLHVRDKKVNLRRYSHPAVPIAVTLRRFSSGQSFSVASTNQEQLLTLLSGELEVSGDIETSLKRKNVFDDLPTALYVGGGNRVRFRARQAGEVLSVACTTEKPGPLEVLSSNQERRGKPGFERTVRNILSFEFPSERLLIGETVNEPGNWSSFPPHKHDRRAKDESKLQEVYFFKIEPEDGFGFMRLYDDRRMETALTVRNNDLVWIPKGYHPVAAMPGHRLYYLWALAGDGRELKWNTDPRYRWLL